MRLHFSPADSTPADAYGRVTNAERFQPLHSIAIQLLGELEATYDVVRSDRFNVLRTMSAFEHARIPATLTPRDLSSAPVSVAFTTFPGLLVRYGHWLIDGFPACGCDACAETLEDEEARLRTLLGTITAGGLREQISIPWIGSARLHWSFPDAPSGPFGVAWRMLPRADARALRAGYPPRMHWRAWQVRRP